MRSISLRLPPELLWSTFTVLEGSMYLVPGSYPSSRLLISCYYEVISMLWKTVDLFLHQRGCCVQSRYLSSNWVTISRKCATASASDNKSNIPQLVDFERRMPCIPDIIHLETLVVDGDVVFGQNVKLAGNVQSLWAAFDKCIPDKSI